MTKARQPKYLFVSWCPHDALQGMEELEPMEELAYRRVLDFIYTHKDQLADDDRRMARLTKTGRRWPRIKESLLRLGKIEIENGCITNARCRRELDAIEHKIAEAKRAGFLSARKRKQLKQQETGAADVPTDVPTEGVTKGELTHQPLPSLQEGNTPAEPGKAYAFEGRVIKLNGADLLLWRQSFHLVDLLPFLTSRDAWLASDRATDRDRKDWFISTVRVLEKQQAKLSAQAKSAPPPAPRAEAAPGSDPITGRTPYQQRLIEWTQGGCRGPRPVEDEAA